MSRPYEMVQVGSACPGSPCGDIFVSEALLAQVGIQEVRRMVRETYRAAYLAKEKRPDSHEEEARP